MKTINKFYDVLKEQLDTSLKQEESIKKVSEVFTETILNNGVIHVFGCGHSQMFGQELCYRTGGLVPINAIMVPHYSIFPNARISQVMERSDNIAKTVLDSLNTSSNDAMLIVSISGRNNAGIEMALAAKEKGMRVIALTSINYSSKVTSRHPSGKLLMDVADYVLDLPGVEGDAVLENPKVANKFCSTSTIIGMSLLVGIIGEVIEELAAKGFNPPVWVSGNLDRGDAINNEYIKEYKGKVSVL